MVLALKKTNLGKYLYSCRMLRGAGNVGEYLSAYSVDCVSESYYRDLEGGRRVLRIETAGKLSDQLDLDMVSLYRHLLKDVLPGAVFHELGLESREVDASFGAVEGELVRQREELVREKGIKDIALRALVRNTSDSEIEIDDDTVAMLESNYYLLPVIHFVYMRKSCAFDELQSILERNGVKVALRDIVDILERHNLAEIDRSACVIRRHLPIFRVPRTRKGTAFKNKFLIEEVKKSIEKPRGTSISADTTWISSSISCIIPGDAAHAVEEKLGEFHAVFSNHDKSLDDGGAVPYFVSVIISPRQEYDIPRADVQSDKEDEGET